jgi:hypothetical protein
MQISSPIRLKNYVQTCIVAASSRMPFPKLDTADPVPGSSLSGVALGASPRQKSADLPKTGAAKAGSSVTGSTQ